jgi:hypothetical protein
MIITGQHRNNMKEMFDKSLSKPLTNLLFLLLLFAPNNILGSMVQIVIMLLVFGFTLWARKGNAIKPLSLIKFVFICWFILVLLYSQFAGFELFSQSVIKLVSILLLFLLFPFSIKAYLDQRLLLGSAVFIVFTQLSYIIGISPVIDFINNYYTPEEYFNSAETVASEKEIRDLFSLRFGGIFRNVNQCGRNITLLFAISLLNLYRDKSKLRMVFATLFVLFAGIILTGSRTSFLTMSLLLAVYVIYFLKVNRTFVITGILFVVIPVFLFLGPSTRLLDFSELSGGSKYQSFSVKLAFLDTYISETNNTNPSHLFFGRFNIDNVNYNYGLEIFKFDSEIGYLLHALGLVGVILIFTFYLRIFLSGGKRTRFIMILLLWISSSTILTSFRFSVLFFFVLSIFYQLDLNFKNSNSKELIKEHN